MGIDYTTTGIIASIKRRAIFPTSQNLYLPQDIANILTEELHSYVVPLIMKEHEEYLVTNYDQAITAGKQNYFIPYQAMGLKVRDVVLVTSGGEEIGLARVEPEELKLIRSGAAYWRQGFYFDNDQVILVPTNQDYSSYTLRMKIFRRPNNLVLSSAAAQISVVTPGTKTITVSTTIPTTWTTAMTFDLIKGKPSFRCNGENLAVTTISGFDIVMTAALPSDLAVGDWIALNGFSPIPQIPYEIHRILEQRAVVKILEGMKDKGGMENAMNDLDGANNPTSMVANFRALVSPRADGSVQRLVSKGGIARNMGGRARFT